VTVQEHDSGGCDVEAQAQQGREQQQSGERNKLEDLPNPHCRNQNSNRNPDVKDEEKVQ